MGTLHYARQAFEFEDRLLAHLQIVVSTKLRRHEPFILSWTRPVEMGSGRHAIWIDNDLPITFSFTGTRPVRINRPWIDQMLVAATRANGLLVDEEPPEHDGN